MQLTLSTAITLLTCAAGSVSATLSGHPALGSRDTSFQELAARYEAGMPDPRLSKRNLQNRAFQYDPSVQTMSTIGIFDTNNGTSLGYVTIFGNGVTNTTQGTQFVYVTAAAATFQSIELQYPEQGGTWTSQLTASTNQAATGGLNSPTVSASVKSDLYVGVYPLSSAVGATPQYSDQYTTWYETAVWTVAADGTLTCTWVNPDGSTIQLYPYLIIGALHLSPNPALLYPWGGPWFTIQTVTLKLTN